MEVNRCKAGLDSPKTAKQLLDMYFLDIRSALLETASAFDRFERAEGGDEIFSDPRLGNLKRACDIIQNSKGNRTEQFLTLFSEPG